ncbi:MAG: hypothetical protein H0U74_21675 [Bradymonadaceae bacterium]|nr:hypothetical protein [Lujinxingiaceae bacterium]
MCLLAVLFFAPSAFAQFNAARGQSAPMESVEREYRDKDGTVSRRIVEQKPQADAHGNPHSPKYDLAVDGAFEGQTVAVLQLYVDSAFDFSLPRAALAEKGFSVYRWIKEPPSPEELEKQLAKACQLWVISDSSRKLNEGHLKVIKKFFDSGRGVYIWGDNEPYYADANYVAEALLGVTMSGNLPGQQVVSVQEQSGKKGFMLNHDITTGLEFLYEGVTIATIAPNPHLTPLIHGSADNLVAAIYDRDGKRAVLDGAFTRLYVSWDTAGSGRYVKNAASWLVNYERFGDKVVGAKVANEKVSVKTSDKRLR